MPRWTDTLDRMTSDVRNIFGGALTLTRGDQSVQFAGILDLDAKTAPVSPADYATEGTRIELDVRVADLAPIGRPQHNDRVTTDEGRVFEVVAVEDGAHGCVVCQFLEVEE